MNLEEIKNGVIVSCQALEDEPLFSSFIMSKMALAAKEGGSVGIRANSVADIQMIQEEVDLPVIGIIKRDYEDSDIYITATSKEVDELLTTKAEIIALDATNRPRPNKEKLSDLVQQIHDGKRLVMADISTFEEGIFAQEIGVDLISTTLVGYTPYSDQLDAPAFDLIKKLTQAVSIPVIMEGHTSRPSDVTEALKNGAFAVVVGSIITRPQLITKKYVDATGNGSA